MWQGNAELCAAAGKMIYTILSDLHTTVESALENITGGVEYLRLWQNYNNVLVLLEWKGLLSMSILALTKYVYVVSLSYSRNLPMRIAIRIL
jgi:hypothetical protein